MSPESTRPVRRALIGALFGIAAAVVLIDQVTKQIAIAVLEGRPPVPVLGDLAGFSFYRNPGAAFGMGESTTWVFALVALAVFAVIVVMSRRLGSRAWSWALGLLLGGLTGNLLDRLFRPPGFMHGAVVDFIDLHFFICNVADIAISAAAVVIVLTTLRGIGLDGRLESAEQVTSEREDAHSEEQPS